MNNTDLSPSIFSLSSWGYVLFIFAIAFVFGLSYRSILLQIARSKPRKASKNIDASGRVIRLIIGIGLLLLAIFTDWSPWVLFFSGFAFFEAIFSWCGFNAAIGRNTCPVE